MYKTTHGRFKSAASNTTVPEVAIAASAMPIKSYRRADFTNFISQSPISIKFSTLSATGRKNLKFLSKIFVAASISGNKSLISCLREPGISKITLSSSFKPKNLRASVFDIEVLTVSTNGLPKKKIFAPAAS